MRVRCLSLAFIKLDELGDYQDQIKWPVDSLMSVVFGET